MMDLEFRREILDVHSAAQFSYCYQCNRCTSRCPISEAIGSDKYSPRRIIMNSFLGFKDVLLNKDDMIALWGCTYCDTCDEICPNEIKLTEIFYLLKNKAIEAGIAPEWPVLQAATILEHGKAIPLMAAIERRRTQMKLPEVPQPNIKELQIIMKETGAEAIIQKLTKK
ncbi:MAG: 4Fe-4S dicluster domain-containing protein [Candidatus Helarchaeota archaeon]